MTRPDPKSVAVMASVAGVPIDDATAARIANAVGPIFDNFAPIAGTLPLDLEPATFVVVQQANEQVES
ncbi:MAG: hypothetical protein JWR29_1994 [Tardiphaga sp.]|jgi:hypothetical protein|nr:hypothetical protein [Tardiphaga sp.]